MRIYYLRRKVPEALWPMFNCGELYKVTLGTSDRREAEKKLAIANGEFESRHVLALCRIIGPPTLWIAISLGGSSSRSIISRDSNAQPIERIGER